MIIIFIRAIVLYALIIFSIRLMGKRQIGQLQPSELVITILVSNIATLPLEDPSLPMILGFVPILVLVCLDVIMSGVTLKFRKIRRYTSGSPKVIIQNGILNQQELKILRFSIDDIMESLHSYNIFDISEVQYAVVETTGQISVYQKFPYQNVINKDLNIHEKTQDPPYIIIDDGQLITNALSNVNINEKWVLSLLKEKGLTVKDIFLLTVSPDKTYNIIKKDRSK